MCPHRKDLKTRRFEPLRDIFLPHFFFLFQKEKWYRVESFGICRRQTFPNMLRRRAHGAPLYKVNIKFFFGFKYFKKKILFPYCIYSAKIFAHVRAVIGCGLYRSSYDTGTQHNAAHISSILFYIRVTSPFPSINVE